MSRVKDIITVLVCTNADIFRAGLAHAEFHLLLLYHLILPCLLNVYVLLHSLQITLCSLPLANHFNQYVLFLCLIRYSGSVLFEYNFAWVELSSAWREKEIARSS